MGRVTYQTLAPFEPSASDEVGTRMNALPKLGEKHDAVRTRRLAQTHVFPLVLGDASREPIYAGYRRVGLKLIDTKILDWRIMLIENRPLRRATNSWPGHSLPGNISFARLFSPRSRPLRGELLNAWILAALSAARRGFLRSFRQAIRKHRRGS
jgi:hypothetical protein